MTAVTVALDTRQLEAWAGQTTKKITKELRSAVDKSARYARNKTIPVMAKDSGVPASRFRAATPLVKGSTAADLSATWTVGKSGNFIRGAGGAVLLPTQGHGVVGSTFAVTGGRSSSLNLSRSFSLGGRGVFTRRGPGKLNFKPVYAESPNTGMAQADGAPRKAWQAAAEIATPLLIVAAVQAALDGASQAPTVAKLAGSTT